jgi:2-polyprenyl-3-methyl-5-hydroxy-6-metoxy-1,4-benzoquinol methylase
MKQTISHYKPLTHPIVSDQQVLGDSASPKNLIFHAVPDHQQAVKVLDIGFGAGNLGKLIKTNPSTQHWEVDGIDGWEANCLNASLCEVPTYRHVWHGLAQELSAEQLGSYDVICLLDVIEHLDVDTSQDLFRFLLASLSPTGVMFISTPLWFYPQDSVQTGDLEAHLIGVPASSMMALIPRMYAINQPLIGGFIFGKESLPYVDFFHPTDNKSFSYDMGLAIVKATGMRYEPGVLVKLR